MWHGRLIYMAGIFMCLSGAANASDSAMATALDLLGFDPAAPSSDYSLVNDGANKSHDKLQRKKVYKSENERLVLKGRNLGEASQMAFLRIKARKESEFCKDFTAKMETGRGQGKNTRGLQLWEYSLDVNALDQSRKETVIFTPTENGGCRVIIDRRSGKFGPEKKKTLSAQKTKALKKQRSSSPELPSLSSFAEKL